MSNVLHFATCPAWTSGAEADCNCQPDPAWKIRKDETEQFPWRIYRHTGDQVYEPLMGCSTWARAVSMVDGFAWLRQQQLIKRSTEDA